MDYNAFMSYSHAADGKLAPSLQHALHQFAKPWYRLRALRIFRDTTNLHVTPKLWPAIQSALDQSAYFILLASPEAAASEWVRREIEHWLGRCPADRMLIVLTSGSLEWDDAAGAFDAARSTALPPRLMSAFREEPLYLDLTWARGEIDLSSRHPRFREAVADLAVPLHGREKDELVGEDVRQHRRTKRLATSAVAGLCALTAISSIAAIFAVRQRNAAETQSRIALARQLAAQSATILSQFPDRLPLSVLLALESTRLHSSFETNHALRAGLTLLPRALQRFSPDGSDPIQDRIRSLAFSPDRNYVAVARDNGTATVMDLAQGKPIAVFRHGEEVTTVAFSPDSRLLASGSNDHSARLWDVASAREVARLVHDGPVSSAAFDPSGAYLATGSKDGKMRLFKAEFKPAGGEAVIEEIVDFKQAEEVREVAFSPDGLYLAGVSTDGGILVANVQKRAMHHKWFAGDSGLGLAFSRDGKKLATANGGYAFVWDVGTSSKVFQATHAESRSEAGAPQSWIDDVAFSPDGNYLATGGRDRTARVWNIESGQEWVRLKHESPVDTVEFGHDGGTLSTGSPYGARLWEVPSGRERWRVAGGNEIVAFSPDGNLVASGGSEGFVEVLNLSRGDQVARMANPEAVEIVAPSPDGSKLVVTDRKGGMLLWSSSGELIATSKQLVYGAKRVAFSEDGRFIAASARSPYLGVVNVAEGLTATTLAKFDEIGDPLVNSRYIAATTSDHTRVRIWESSGGRELPPVDADNVDKLEFDGTGKFLAIRQWDSRAKIGVIRIWDVAQSRETGRLSIQGVGDFAISPEGRFLALNSWEKAAGKPSGNHYLEVWDLTSATRVCRIPKDGAAGYPAFYGSGLLTIASDSRTVEMWEVPTGNLKARLPHEDNIDGIRIAPMDGVLATLSAGLVYVWNLSTGELMTQLAAAGRIVDFKFTPDGRRLLTGNDEGIAALWLWKTEDLQEETCKRLTRNLSLSEWRQYLGTIPYQRACPNLPVPE